VVSDLSVTAKYLHTLYLEDLLKRIQEGKLDVQDARPSCQVRGISRSESTIRFA
jgi:hypothetical protein